MEKDRKEPANTEGASLMSQDVYCVCFPQRDSIETLQGELAEARKRFFTNGRKTVKVGRRETVKGFDGELRGKISRRDFYWKKTALGVSGQKGVALEEAFGQKGGYVLVNRDFRGAIVSRVFFNKEHAWQKSEYYEPWDPATAKVMFKPDLMGDTIDRYDWDPDKRLYRSVILHPAPYQPGSAEQALVNARFGEPQLLVAVGDGQLCYCPQKEAEARAHALDDINSGNMVLMPAWEIKEGAFLGDEGEEDTAVTFTSLEEYARVGAKEEKPAQAPLPPVPEQAEDGPGPMEEEPVQADELDIEFILADARQEAVPEPPKRAALDEPIGPSVETDDAAILSAARHASRANAPSRPKMDEEDVSILQAARQAGRTEPARQTGAQRHARKPVLSGGSGSMQAGKLTGKGRTEQPGGITAYEGDYKDGRRDGFGSSYYKSGDLSYAGFWRGDKKDGLGVSFREGDHVLHVSRWKQGHPGQQVSLFDMEGNLRFSGRILNGKKEGAGVSIDGADGSVLVTKWADGQNTGLASAFDPEGNLLYYGSWKNGKRHGHGTEFDKNGGVVFDGEWRNDQYFNGILYQRPTDTPQPADPDCTGPDWEI